jgi:hypothetical protein
MKKQVFLLICIASMLCMMMVSTNATTTSVTSSDSADMREADIQDVLDILKYLAGLQVLSVITHDFDKNGIIDIQDALYALKGLSNLQDPIKLPKRLESLPKELEQRIQSAFFGKVVELKVNHYFGTYNGSVVVAMFPVDHSIPAHFENYEIAGYRVLARPTDDILVWNNGRGNSLIGAYNEGWITEQDVSHLLFHYASVFPRNVWILPEPILCRPCCNGEVLSDEMRLTIKNDWLRLKNAPDFVGVDTIQGFQYYGTYNGNIAFLLGHYFIPGYIFSENILGYIFNISSVFRYYVWSDGAIYTLLEASNEDLITKQDVGYIYFCVNGHRYW